MAAPRQPGPPEPGAAAADDEAEDEQHFLALIRGLDGQELATLTLPAGATVHDVKLRLAGERGVPFFTQRILLGGRVLEDEDAVLDVRLLDPGGGPAAAANPAPVVELLLIRLPFEEAAGAELLWYSWRGDPEGVARALRAPACPNHLSAEDDERTPLLSAALQGHTDIVRQLCVAGADTNLQVGEGATPLLAAAAQGHAEVVRLLAEAQADISRSTTRGTTPLHAAALQGHLDVVSALCEIGADTETVCSNGATPLYVACFNGYLDVARRLCCGGGAASGSASQQVVSPAALSGASCGGAGPLHAACQGGHLEVVRYLCEDVGAPIDARMRDGASPLLSAALQGHAIIVAYLCGARADVNGPTRDGATPMHAAARSGHCEVVRLLCELGAAKDAVMVEGATPMLAAALQGHAEVVAYLCSQRADLYNPIPDGVTPLHSASERGHAPVVEVLCAARADVSREMRNGLTPLLVASMQGHVAAIRHLCEARADLNQPIREPLVLAISACSGPSATHLVLQHPLPGLEHVPGATTGATPLVQADSQGHAAAVQCLLQARADPTRCARHGAAALGVSEPWAAAGSSGAPAAWRASVHLESPCGWTALHRAAVRGQLEEVRHLCLEGYTDPLQPAHNGVTPLLAARLVGQSEVARFLEEVAASERRRRCTLQ